MAPVPPNHGAAGLIHRRRTRSPDDRSDSPDPDGTTNRPAIEAAGHDRALHARYGDRKARILISPVGLLEGTLPPRALAFAVEWATLHRDELLENWRRLRAREHASPIAPLE